MHSFDTFQMAFNSQGIQIMTKFKIIDTQKTLTFNRIICQIYTSIPTHENDHAQNYRSSLLKWHADSGTHVEL